MSYRSYKKYLDDYSIEEHIDENGRKKKVPVYIASYYLLTPALTKNEKRMILAASLLSWVSIIVPLCFKGSNYEMWYILIPYMFTVFPLYNVTAGAISLLVAGEKMERQKADKIASRLPYPSLFSALLPLASFIGITISAAINWGSMVEGDKLFLMLTPIATISAAFIFMKCRKLSTYIL